MKQFRIEGTFEAEDIDDAFAKLAAHFAALAAGLELGPWGPLDLHVRPTPGNYGPGNGKPAEKDDDG